MRHLAAVGLAIMVCAGCVAPPPTPTRIATPNANSEMTANAEYLATIRAAQPAITRTSGPRPTKTDSPTPTVAPTSTVPPTPLSNTANPVSLSPGGPWLIFQARLSDSGAADSIAAINPDGTGLTELVTEDMILSVTPSPVGSLESVLRVAYVTRDQASGKYLLKQLTLPGRDVITLSELNKTYEGWQLTTSLSQATPEWSHDGQRLAFAAGNDGDSVDIYVLSLGSGGITRITDSATSPTGIWWSPDDKFLLYGESEFPTDPPFGHYEFWAAHSDGSGDPLKVQEITTQPILYGWQDNHTAMLGGTGQIRRVDLDTGDESLIYEGRVVDAAYAADEDLWAIIESQDCYASPESARLVLFHAEGPLSTFPGGCQQIAYWIKQVGQFIVYQSYESGEAQLLSPEGVMLPFIAPGEYPLRPDVSPDGRYWAWPYAIYGEGFGYSNGLWIGTPGSDFKQIYKDDVSSVLWTDDSSTLIFGGEDGMYLASAPDFEPRIAARTYYFGFWNAYWIR